MSWGLISIGSLEVRKTSGSKSVVCDEDGLVTLVYAVPPRLAELGIRPAERKPEDPEYQVVADDIVAPR